MWQVVNMSYATLNAQAIALAKATPDHAGKSASPPISFWLEGEDLVILCADYRKVRATPDQIKQIMAADVGAKRSAPQAYASPAPVMPAPFAQVQVSLPTHPAAIPAPPIPERGKPAPVHRKSVNQ
jgi:hypothetical protein